VNRRQFLAGTAAAGGLLVGGRAWGRAWGEAPEISAPLILPAGTRAESVLEVFAYGGLSPWESFYTVPESPAWQLFQADHTSVYGASCGIPTDALTMPWATASDGTMVHLGPHVMPLRNRPDLLARMRVVVLRHDLEPHEAAIPHALSGMRLGSPRMVGMGGHLQRFWLDRAPRVQPYSYVLQPENIIGTDNTRAASAIGLHPGSARPLSLKVASSQLFLSRLQRNRMGDEAAAWDALVGHYGARTRDRYTMDGTPLRSAGLDDYESAMASIRQAPDIRALLGTDFMANRGGAACGDQGDTSFVAMGLEAGVQLLTHPTHPARYVNVVDTGLFEADGGGGYDTHEQHLHPQARNTTHLLEELVARINAPGEADPMKIDLDRTMVLLTTEFGRTPFRQDGGDGTNHHPYGYVSVVLGGPIGPDQAGIAGAIGPDGLATDHTTPAEMRAAMLAACGIYPFAHESFAVGDIRDVPTERDGLAYVTERVLGRPV
jgi:hypothetical protein